MPTNKGKRRLWRPRMRQTLATLRIRPARRLSLTAWPTTGEPVSRHRTLAEWMLTCGCLVASLRIFPSIAPFPHRALTAVACKIVATSLLAGDWGIVVTAVCLSTVCARALSSWRLFRTIGPLHGQFNSFRVVCWAHCLRLLPSIEPLTGL